MQVQGVRVPDILYGTAWKEDETARLTSLALETGFRGIDAANQRRHYHEAGVGEALAPFLISGKIRREEVFLQTKFTYLDGQDHRLPYDRNAPHATQVAQSFASSLQHLGVASLDSYVLHGPSTGRGLAAADWETWEAMENLHATGKTRLLGVSNVTIDQLKELHKSSSVKPAMVQNRCYSSTGWDRRVRSFCSENDILYQGFSLLTANPGVLRHPGVQAIAARLHRTPEQVVLRFAIQLPMIALSGTTSATHMKEDLEILDFELGRDEMERIQTLGE